MNQTLEQTSNNVQPAGDDVFMKAVVESATANKVAIGEIKEAIRKIPDTTAILQELGKRMGAEEKRQQELVSAIGELGGSIGEVNGSLKKLAERLTFPVDAFSKLRSDLEQHHAFFEKPHRKEVHYRHFLGKPLLALIISILVITVLVVLLTQAWGRSDQHAENDLKWRYLHLSADAPGLDALDKVTGNYKANPEQFRKYVIDEEDRQRQLFDQQQRALRAQEEIDKLEKKKR